MADWMPRIDSNLCNGCGLCITHCPTHALGWKDGKATLVLPLHCIYCATCESVCPTNAIELPYLICLSNPEQDSERRETHEQADV